MSIPKTALILVLTLFAILKSLWKRWRPVPPAPIINQKTRKRPRTALFAALKLIKSRL